MSETIPDDLAKIGLTTWIDALRDGTPDAGNIIARAILAERERCAEVCRLVEQDFLSPEYSTNQPASSFCERFACREVLRGIEIPETRAIRTPSTGEEQ